MTFRCKRSHWEAISRAKSSHPCNGIKQPDYRIDDEDMQVEEEEQRRSRRIVTAIKPYRTHNSNSNNKTANDFMDEMDDTGLGIGSSRNGSFAAGSKDHGAFAVGVTRFHVPNCLDLDESVEMEQDDEDHVDKTKEIEPDDVMNSRKRQRLLTSRNAGRFGQPTDRSFSAWALQLPEPPQHIRSLSETLQQQPREQQEQEQPLRQQVQEQLPPPIPTIVPPRPVPAALEPPRPELQPHHPTRVYSLLSHQTLLFGTVPLAPPCRSSVAMATTATPTVQTLRIRHDQGSMEYTGNQVECPAMASRSPAPATPPISLINLHDAIAAVADPLDLEDPVPAPVVENTCTPSNDARYNKSGWKGANSGLVMELAFAVLLTAVICIAMDPGSFVSNSREIVSSTLGVATSALSSLWPFMRQPCFVDSPHNLHKNGRHPSHCPMDQAMRLPCPEHGVCTKGRLIGCDKQYLGPSKSGTSCEWTKVAVDQVKQLQTTLEECTSQTMCTSNPSNVDYFVRHVGKSKRPLFSYLDLAKAHNQEYDPAMLRAFNKDNKDGVVFLVTTREDGSNLVGLHPSRPVTLSMQCTVSNWLFDVWRRFLALFKTYASKVVSVILLPFLVAMELYLIMIVNEYLRKWWPLDEESEAQFGNEDTMYEERSCWHELYAALARFQHGMRRMLTRDDGDTTHWQPQYAERSWEEQDDIREETSYWNILCDMLARLYKWIGQAFKRSRWQYMEDPCESHLASHDNVHGESVWTPYLRWILLVALGCSHECSEDGPF